MHNNEMKKGIFFALSAYILWGILPLYWHLIHGIGPFEILAFRIVLSMIFMLIVAIVSKQTHFGADVNQLFKHPIQLIAIIVAGYVITINWGHLFGPLTTDTSYKRVSATISILS